MAIVDLAKLKIDRSAAPAGRPRRRWGRIALIAALIGIAAAVAGARYNAAPAVEAVTVAQAYPSQNYTLLNATGYVVAQRKAAVGSKATGRLEWLGVLEGSHVQKGEVIARLENRDVTAALDQTAANVSVAQANLEQGRAELLDAEQAFKRSQDLLAKNSFPPLRTMLPSRATTRPGRRWPVIARRSAPLRQTGAPPRSTSTRR